MVKIFDAVYMAAVFLQLDGVCERLRDEDFDAETWRDAADDEAREIDLLVRCCRLVLHELSETGFPLREEAETEAKRGKIAYSALPHEVVNIFSVTKGHRTLPFREYYDGVTVPAGGKVRVLYGYAPPEVDLDSDSPYASGVPSARLLAYGIAREYSLIGGMTDEASMWDGRFNDCACDELRGKKRERRIRARVWR